MPFLQPTRSECKGCLVWSGLVWLSVPIEFPRRFICVNPRNCTYEFQRRCISVNPRNCTTEFPRKCISVNPRKLFFQCKFNSRVLYACIKQIVLFTLNRQYFLLQQSTFYFEQIVLFTLVLFLLSNSTVLYACIKQIVLFTLNRQYFLLW